MDKKLDEIAVFNEDMINETEVKIYAENFLELEGLLNKIK